MPAEPVHRLRSVSARPTDDGTTVRRLEFVPVGEPPQERTRTSKRRAKREVEAPVPAPAPTEPRWSLWGDLES